jgi:uncharacterized RDD family membrane protein YckC
MQDILTGFDYSPPPASRKRRWTACLIDYFICFTVMGLGAVVFGEKTIDADGSASWTAHGGVAWLIMLPTWLFFFPIIESFNGGQTIGKALFKIKTVRNDFSKLSFSASLFKHMFDIIDFLPLFGILGLLVTTNNKYKQRIGDLVAKTVVIDAAYTPQAQNQ